MDSLLRLVHKRMSDDNLSVQAAAVAASPMLVNACARLGANPSFDDLLRAASELHPVALELIEGLLRACQSDYAGTREAALVALGQCAGLASKTQSNLYL